MLIDPHPASAGRNRRLRVPPAGTMGLLRPAGKDGLQPDSLARFHSLHVPDGIVPHVRIRNGDRHIVRHRIGERQVDHFLALSEDIADPPNRRHGLLASEARRPVDARAQTGLRNVHHRLLAIHPDPPRHLRLKPVRDTVVARGKADAPVAEVDERLVSGEIDPRLLVDRRLGHPRLHLPLHTARSTGHKARPIHLHADLRLGDGHVAAPQDLVGERIRPQPDLVLSVRRNRGNRIRTRLAEKATTGQCQDAQQ